MTSKHTPGPWGISKAVNVWIMAGALHVASVPRAHDSDWSEANALLIAAAPDLLAACVQAYGDIIEGKPVDMEKLDRAIAKAEGRS